jgi:enamine deaminase RidA (YjgF/YER057c/UK114 family)
MTIRRVFSGAPWEKRVGYCRAVRNGKQIAVSGTTSVDGSGGVWAKGDAYSQAKRCFEIIEKALAELGAELKDVIRTRTFVTDISRWEEFGRAHAEVFSEFPPAASMYEVKSLIDPDLLVEIEVDACLASD